MDTLDGTNWDVLIAGTGIQQSLLALALSRSDKKILHIDKNDYYGGAEGAFSLQEAEHWVESLQHAASTHNAFENASITKASSSDESSSKLSFSRAYSLALAPQLIYTDSELLPALVSSKTYRQLEFVAMGSWFVYDKEQLQVRDDDPRGALLKVPTTREDLVFSDKSIDIRSKRAVMKLLRFLMEFEAQEDVWQPFADKPFSEFLSGQFKLPSRLHSLFFALTLSLDPPQNTTTAFALPKIARHLRSTGQLGPGFNSVIPKWGGLSEISQVACRAGAVGGAVYVLNKELKTATESDQEEYNQSRLDVTLSDDEKVKASWIAGTGENLPPGSNGLDREDSTSANIIRRSISIVSSTLSTLFPALAEGGPPPAGAVVVFPAYSLSENSSSVYLIIHSSDTGECPEGQCVIYATTHGPTALLDEALDRLLKLTNESPHPVALWSLKYEQRGYTLPETSANLVGEEAKTITFPPLSLDLAFDETVLNTVKEAWQTIMGPDTQDFLVFEDRNPMGDDDEE